MCDGAVGRRGARRLGRHRPLRLHVARRAPRPLAAEQSRKGEGRRSRRPSSSRAQETAASAPAIPGLRVSPITTPAVPGGLMRRLVAPSLALLALAAAAAATIVVRQELPDL